MIYLSVWEQGVSKRRFVCSDSRTSFWSPLEEGVCFEVEGVPNGIPWELILRLLIQAVPYIHTSVRPSVRTYVLASVRPYVRTYVSTYVRTYVTHTQEWEDCDGELAMMHLRPRQHLTWRALLHAHLLSASLNPKPQTLNPKP